MTGRPNYYDDTLATEADQTIETAIAEFLTGPPRITLGGERFHVVVTAAPAGAGKTHLVTTTVERAVTATRGAPATIVIGTPTNDQAFQLVDRIARRLTNHQVAFVPASTVTLPAPVAALPNVDSVTPVDAAAYPIVVGTLDKLGDCATRETLQPRSFRYLTVDESYQASSSQYFPVAHLADRHLLVGDPGQLDPFSTMPDADRWRGLAEDPVATAVAVVLRNHGPAVPVFRLPVTRRLPAHAIHVVRSFYPGHDFGAWTLPGVRQLELTRALGRGPTAEADAALDTAVRTGWAYLRQPDSAVLTADPVTAERITAVTERLFARGATVIDERTRGRSVPLTQERVGVIVSHRSQAALIRLELDRRGLTNVRVATANEMQGLEYDVTVAWHPLAGLPTPDTFHLDPGRLAVMLTRHRHACLLVGRTADEDLVDAVPPPAPSYLDQTDDPTVDGWFAHRAVFNALRDSTLDVA